MDRQDIDALLIGALYGELTPADEARLVAHLESHPSDKGALDDLKSARQAVRESRIFDVQVDPPQAVSALLLQEAHRRAPKRVVSDDAKESWFARFTRVFIAHPAMAAAAMLVLVVGVAGTLYLKKGDQFAGKEASIDQPAAIQPASEAPAPEPGDRAAPVEEPSAAAGSGFDVKLQDSELEKAAGTQKDLAPTKPEPPRQRAPEHKQDEAQKKAKAKGIPVQTTSPTVKELGEDDAKADRFNDGQATPSRAPAANRGAGGGAATQGYAQPPPPAPAAPAADKPTTATVAAPKGATKPADTKAETTATMDPSLLAWAKGQRDKAFAAARDNDCRQAATIAVNVSNRAPEFYAQYMATARELKGCQQYIAREKDAEKSRAQKRANATETLDSK